MLMQFKGASEGCLAIFLFNNLWDSVPDYVLVVKGCKAQHIALPWQQFAQLHQCLHKKIDDDI